MVTIEVNDTTEAGKVLLEVARLISSEKKGVKIVESPYKKDFVKEIISREKDSQGKKISRVDPEKVWEKILQEM